MSTDIDPALLALLSTHRQGVLTTLKRDGRPQQSVIGYAFDPETLRFRVSVTDSRAKTKNLRRDPRVSLCVPAQGYGGYAVVDGTAELTPVAAEPHDETVDALVDLYRDLAGEHPDWDEYRAAMVSEGRLVLSFAADHAYGWASQA